MFDNLDNYTFFKGGKMGRLDMDGIFTNLVQAFVG